jgi:CheY-like chemotaxis protein
VAHILVVDDSAANRDLLAYLLTYVGHRVSQAPDGNAAIALARADPPDLVVMDLAMPGIDGYAAAHLMRLDPAMNGVPLIAVSATGRATPEAAAAAGFDDFYPMPIDPETFVAMLEPLLHRVGGAPLT